MSSFFCYSDSFSVNISPDLFFVAYLDLVSGRKNCKKYACLKFLLLKSSSIYSHEIMEIMLMCLLVAHHTEIASTNAYQTFNIQCYFMWL